MFGDQQEGAPSEVETTSQSEPLEVTSWDDIQQVVTCAVCHLSSEELSL